MSSDDETNDAPESQMGFVMMLQEYPAIFQKSQTPASRKAKAVSYVKIQEMYQKNTGEKISVSQLLKKVNNMKTRLKKKSDINRTGNKKIILRGWEQKLLELLEGGNSNPSIHSLSGKTFQTFSFLVVCTYLLFHRRNFCRNCFKYKSY
jgi:hypothetical protein